MNFPRSQLHHRHWRVTNLLMHTSGQRFLTTWRSLWPYGTRIDPLGAYKASHMRCHEPRVPRSANRATVARSCLASLALPRAKLMAALPRSNFIEQCHLFIRQIWLGQQPVKFIFPLSREDCDAINILGILLTFYALAAITVGVQPECQ